MHIPGRLLGGMDALSRHLGTVEDDQDQARTQEAVVEGIYHQTDPSLGHTSGETCKKAVVVINRYFQRQSQSIGDFETN